MNVPNILKLIVTLCEMPFKMVTFALLMFLLLHNLQIYSLRHWGKLSFLFFFASWAFVIFMLQLEEGCQGLLCILGLMCIFVVDSMYQGFPSLLYIYLLINNTRQGFQFCYIPSLENMILTLFKTKFDYQLYMLSNRVVHLLS